MECSINYSLSFKIQIELLIKCFNWESKYLTINWYEPLGNTNLAKHFQTTGLTIFLFHSHLHCYGHYFHNLKVHLLPTTLEKCVSICSWMFVHGS